MNVSPLSGSESNARRMVLAALRQTVERLELRSLLVAFSGGPDSSSLLQACVDLRDELDPHFTCVAAHLDHGLDAGSADRCRRAEAIARRLGVDWISHRADTRPTGTSLEAWARDVRYRFLEAQAERLGCQAIATAHHANDQAETVLLRLLFGSGLGGLAGIRRQHGRIVRPLLDLPRRVLYQAAGQLSAIDDPTNADLSRPRNRIRHRLLPECSINSPHLVSRLGQLAITAERASRHIDAMLDPHLDIRPLHPLDMPCLPAEGASLDRQALAHLPPELFGHAMSRLEKVAGRIYPSARTARHELQRQLSASGGIGCDGGSGWRFEGDSRRVRLLEPREPSPPFTYTVETPGSVQLPQLGAVLRILSTEKSLQRPRRPAELPADIRTLIHLPPDITRLEVRNRRPGDRIQPLGSRHTKSLKHVLIDRRVPRHERDRMPLIVAEGQILWLPGILVVPSFLARKGIPPWSIELVPRESLPTSSAPGRQA